jgi:hypothetical protein
MTAGALEVGDGRHKPMIFEGFRFLLDLLLLGIGHNHVCGSFSSEAA